MATRQTEVTFLLVKHLFLPKHFRFSNFCTICVASPFRRSVEFFWAPRLVAFALLEQMSPLETTALQIFVQLFTFFMYRVCFVDFKNQNKKHRNLNKTYKKNVFTKINPLNVSLYAALLQLSPLEIIPGERNYFDGKCQ